MYFKFGRFPLDIRLFYLWYPADIVYIYILISGVQISSKLLPLVKEFNEEIFSEQIDNGLLSDRSTFFYAACKGS